MTAELDIVDYLSALWRRRLLIGACAVIAAAVTLVVTLLRDRHTRRRCSFRSVSRR